MDTCNAPKSTRFFCLVGTVGTQSVLGLVQRHTHKKLHARSFLAGQTTLLQGEHSIRKVECAVGGMLAAQLPSLQLPCVILLGSGQGLRPV